MAVENREGRPHRDQRCEPAQNISTPIQTQIQFTPSPDILAHLDAVAEHLRGRFVVQVNIEGDHWRTNVYRNAAAAERAVDRAKSRGQRAHVTLCQMLPVGVVVGLGGVR